MMFVRHFALRGDCRVCRESVRCRLLHIYHALCICMVWYLCGYYIYICVCGTMGGGRKNEHTHTLVARSRARKPAIGNRIGGWWGETLAPVYFVLKLAMSEQQHYSEMHTTLKTRIAARSKSLSRIQMNECITQQPARNRRANRVGLVRWISLALIIIVVIFARSHYHRVPSQSSLAAAMVSTRGRDDGQRAYNQTYIQNFDIACIHMIVFLGSNWLGLSLLRVGRALNVNQRSVFKV